MVILQIMVTPVMVEVEALQVDIVMVEQEPVELEQRDKEIMAVAAVDSIIPVAVGSITVASTSTVER